MQLVSFCSCFFFIYKATDSKLVLQMLENLLGRSRYTSFVGSGRKKFYQQVKDNAHIVLLMYSIFPSHLILLQPIFFLSILLFVICSLIKIIKELNI